MKYAFSLMGHCGNPNVYVYIHVCSQVLRMALQDVRTYIYTIHTGKLCCGARRNCVSADLQCLPRFSGAMSCRLHIVTFVFVIALLD